MAGARRPRAAQAARRPFILVLAGVNGAGKSSVGGALLAQHGLTWFNPDTLARELVAHGVPQTEANARAWQHGRERLEAAMAQGLNYAFETTLGARTIPELLARASETHDVVMLYCGLAAVEQHIARVQARVLAGGHAIAPDKIRERWSASRLNLIRLLPHLAKLQVFDNSAEAPAGAPIADPVLLLEMVQGQVRFPGAQDGEALRRTPEWARPIVQAAFEIARPEKQGKIAPSSAARRRTLQ